MIITKPKGGSSIVGTSGYSGFSGYSGHSGAPNTGASGYSGRSGYSGYSGRSGYSGYSGISGYSGGAYSEYEKLNVELEMAFKSANPSNYKELTYTNENLTAVTIYETSGKLVTLFDKALTYNIGGDLIKIVLTRHSDNVTLTKDLAYDVDGNLISITQTKG